MLNQSNLKLGRVAALGFFCAILGGFLFGYHTGVISGAILFIQKYFNLKGAGEELLTGDILWSSFFAILVTGTLSNRIGLKKLLLAANLLIAVSSLADFLSLTFVELISTRLFLGIGLGINTVALTVYITDLAPVKYRNVLLSLYPWAITIGDLASQLFDFLLARSGNWHIMLGIGGIPALIALVGQLFLPESPRWLLSKGRTTEAKKIIDDWGLTQSVHTEQENVDWKHLFKKQVRWITILAVIIASVEQATGIDSLVFYAPLILEKAGLASDRIALGFSLLVSILGSIMSLGAVFIISKFGARMLLRYGLGLITICLAALGGAFILLNPSPLLAFTTVVIMILFNASFDMTVGSVIWVLVPNIFSANLRAPGVSLALSVNWLIYAIITSFFLTFFDVLGVGSTFLLFAAFSAASFIFIKKHSESIKDVSAEEL